MIAWQATATIYLANIPTCLWKKQLSCINVKGKRYTESITQIN